MWLPLVLPEILQGSSQLKWNPTYWLILMSVCDCPCPQMNSQDDNGVLVGNWSGKYRGGTPPLSWIGSIEILRKYHQNKHPVRYAQCWVYAGVFNTCEWCISSYLCGLVSSEHGLILLIALLVSKTICNIAISNSNPCHSVFQNILFPCKYINSHAIFFWRLQTNLYLRIEVSCNCKYVSMPP